MLVSFSMVVLCLGWDWILVCCSGVIGDIWVISLFCSFVIEMFIVSVVCSMYCCCVID